MAFRGGPDAVVGRVPSEVRVPEEVYVRLRKAGGRQGSGMVGGGRQEALVGGARMRRRDHGGNKWGRGEGAWGSKWGRDGTWEGRHMGRCTRGKEGTWCVCWRAHGVIR